MKRKVKDFNFLTTYGYPAQEYRVKSVKNLPRDCPKSWTAYMNKVKNYIVVKKDDRTQMIAGLLHESLHAEFPWIDEFWITAAERHIMDALWASKLLEGIE